MEGKTRWTKYISQSSPPGRVLRMHQAWETETCYLKTSAKWFLFLYHVKMSVTFSNVKLSTQLQATHWCDLFPQYLVMLYELIDNVVNTISAGFLICLETSAICNCSLHFRNFDIRFSTRSSAGFSVFGFISSFLCAVLYL